ncbi:hypothetical protein KIN20_012910 [Parelaphostrongylus tenuis]|uniref:Uncharacterized protein n=1 Tax=Parelaphostrongylus tenuis TaxID=148309 RepID=A0AAD5MCS1_PARTN|nr:hypothetical protein KIN20_012910 [Parelaphostrongylus tenuis]
MFKVPALFLAFSLLISTLTVLGCGVIPAGRASTRSFTVTGFTLPVAMVYTNTLMVSARVGGIATEKGRAQAFVERLVMRIVFNVLERQARIALVPDAVISSILSQLTVKINYEPLLCQAVVLGLADAAIPDRDMKSCIIIGNSVTGICTRMAVRRGGVGDGTCTPGGEGVTITPVAATYTTITGTLSTTNIIMANWSKAMWQNVMNTALRMLASGPLRSNFFSATATVGES